MMVRRMLAIGTLTGICVLPQKPSGGLVITMNVVVVYHQEHITNILMTPAVLIVIVCMHKAARISIVWIGWHTFTLRARIRGA